MKFVSELFMHLNRLVRLDFFWFGEQTDMLGDGEDAIDAFLKLAAQTGAEVVLFWIDKGSFVIRHDDGIRLGEHHLH